VSFTPAQLAKLPKWARDEVRDLERERDIAMQFAANVRENMPKTSVSIEKYGEDVVYIDDAYPITFRFGDKWEQRFDVRLEGEILEVRGGSRLFMSSQATNEFHIHIEDRSR